MIKTRIFTPLWRRRAEQQLSPLNPGVRIAHWLRVGVECVAAIGAAAALASSPGLLGVEDEAIAALPPPAPAFDLEPARLAEAAEAATLAAVFAPLREEREHVAVKTRRGDTLEDVLSRAHVDARDLHAAIVSLKGHFDARDLQTGQDIDLYLARAAEGEKASLVGLTFTPGVALTIQVSRRADGAFRARKLEVPLTRRIARAQGTITESLYTDAIRAGADDAVVNEIARVLAHSVDFQREIHPGDPFEIVFEQDVDPAGEAVRTGNIYYVGFAPSGKKLAYWRYTPPGDKTADFYDATGESAKRFLMKTPINGARLSSGFGSRKHPVLGYTKMHKGTDFAAPRGTPIYAAGAGVVERANVYGSFGNYVRIQHANGYETAYAHLNGFARGVKKGARVTQGQVIAYVGTTGRSTGPHLHYEVHKNGVAMNPMKLSVQTGRLLSAAEKPAFQAARAEIDKLREQAVPASAPPSDVLVAGAPSEEAVETAPAVATQG